MKKYFEILKKCPLFFGIEEESLFRMLDCLGARKEHFEKNQTVISEGVGDGSIGIVLSGAVHTVHIDYYGNRSILSTASPSEIFAEAFACGGAEAIPMSAVASTDSDVLLIDAAHILTTCQNRCGFHQQLIFNLMRSLSEKMLFFYRRIEITSRRTTRDKLMTFLSQEAERSGSSEFDIRYDRQELADFLEVDRSGLSSEISKLVRSGAIESHRSHFKILRAQQK